MNSFVSNLVKQATITYTETLYGDDTAQHTRVQFDREKFAELIVRECAQIAMQQQQSHSFDSYDELTEYERGQDDTASTISGQIKQQFGVEL